MLRDKVRQERAMNRCGRGREMSTRRKIWIHGFLASVLCGAAALPTLGNPAPTSLQSPPSAYFLLTLPGDRVQIQYTPGSLDRAARLQTRLNLVTRTFSRKADHDLNVVVFMLSREEWEQARYPVAYGMPVRVGTQGLAVPAAGDDGTVALWKGLLQGALPQVHGLPLRGTPAQASTMVMADLMSHLLVSEILVDTAGLTGDAPWVRGLMTHTSFLYGIRQHDPGRTVDLDVMYRRLAQASENRPWSARDYGPELVLEDWMWFQSALHFGAQKILDEEGKGALKKLKKLGRKDEGLAGDALLLRYEDLNEWFQSTFSGVSFRPAS